MNNHWYSIGTYKHTKCVNCGTIHIDLARLDHHSGICPHCKIECIWYDLGEGKSIQIVPAFAPTPFLNFIQ